MVRNRQPPDLSRWWSQVQVHSIQKCNLYFYRFVAIIAFEDCGYDQSIRLRPDRDDLLAIRMKPLKSNLTLYTDITCLQVVYQFMCY